MPKPFVDSRLNNLNRRRYQPAEAPELRTISGLILVALILIFLFIDDS